MISTKENIADILTKVLPRETHEKFVRQMGLNWRRRDTRGSVKECVGGARRDLPDIMVFKCFIVTNHSQLFVVYHNI